MKNILYNELLKFSKSKYMIIFFALLFLPLGINIASLLVGQEKTIQEFFFPYYNQLSLFFPLTIGLIISTVFYSEFKNKMYLNWITNGISKSKLYMGKFLFSLILSFTLVIFNYALLILTIKIMNSKITLSQLSILDITVSYFIYTTMLTFFSLLYSSILILLSRNIIVTTSFMFIFMMVSALFMAAPFSYYIPFSFPYRLGLRYIHEEYYFIGVPNATLIGIFTYLVSIVLLWVIVITLMKQKKVIETN